MKNNNGKMLRSLFLVLLLFGFMGIVFSPSSTNAGKGPFPVLINDISWDVCQILKKHGLPIRDEEVEEKGKLVRKTRDQPYYRYGASTGRYTLLFFQADEIPQEAVIEVIRYCMDLYEKRGRTERFRIFLYQEAAPKYHSWFSGPKPFFQLTIGGNN